MARTTSKALFALTAAALDLFGASGSRSEAAGLVDSKSFHYKFTQYSEADLPIANIVATPAGDSGSRYEIDIHQFLYQGPIGPATEVNAAATFETMSGASPWFVSPDADGNPLQIMSGATISEERTDVQLNFKHHAAPNRAYLYGVGLSNENDYQSLNLGYGLSKTTENQLHTLDLIASGSLDSIDATDADSFSRADGEAKRSVSVNLAYTSILNQKLTISNQVNYALFSGFLSDPYKLALVEGVALLDSRPESKNQLSWTFSARRYMPVRRSALHFDYRFYRNSWNLNSHMVEAGWYYNLAQHWQLIPRIRYYTQSQVTFYRLYYTAARSDGFYSSDYRLSEFDALSFKFRINRAFDFGSVHVAFEQYDARGNHPGLVKFGRLSLGFNLVFP